VASLGDFIHNVTYDGESGLMIEAAYDEKEYEFFDFSLDGQCINVDAMIHDIVQIQCSHCSKKMKQQKIASMFINTLIEIIVAIVQRHSDLHVILSGGVFQNKTLLKNVILRFEALGVRYHFQQATPINDGGIAFGQLLAGIKHINRVVLCSS
jgi:hydrogenase maturation protein HypF